MGAYFVYISYAVTPREQHHEQEKGKNIKQRRSICEMAKSGEIEGRIGGEMEGSAPTTSLSQ
jgi:hypothetical protein